MRLRFALTSAPRVDAKFRRHPDTTVSFAPMDALEDGLGGLKPMEVKNFTDLSRGSYNYFENGDVLLAKVTPCFENGKKAIAANLENGAGFATSEVLVFRAQADALDTRFLRYLFCSEDFRHKAIASMTGSGGLRRVSERAVLDFPLRVTHLATQRQIADFLDRETTRIDLLIEKKQRLVTLLKQRETSLITEVTKHGLKGETQLDTGIDWWSRAPASWEVHRVASLFGESKEMGEDGLPVLSVSINWGISDRELADEDRDRIVNLIEDRTSYKRVRPGDLVYNMMRAWQGAFGVAKVDGLVSPAYVVARPRKGLHSAYFEHLLRSPSCVEEFRRSSKGIADFRQRLYWEHFRQVRLVLPAYQEQVEIARHIDLEKERTEPTILKTNTSIDRLREYRSSLITAAVTGQIDVASHSKSGTTESKLDALQEEMDA